jgi:hypothetical protein
VAIFLYWVYNCKNYTIIRAVMCTNLLLVFGVRTANLPITTHVPLCHTKVRGPWSGTNGAVVWPVKHNVQALTRASERVIGANATIFTRNSTVVCSGRIFILRGNQAFISITGVLLTGYLTTHYTFDAQLFFQPQVVPQCEKYVPIIKRRLFGLSVYLIDSHRNHGVPHALPHTQAIIHVQWDMLCR